MKYNITKRKHQVNLFPKGTMGRLLLIGALCGVTDAKLHIRKYVITADMLVKTRGRIQATKDLKQLYSCVKASALGMSIPNPELWSSTDRGKLPRRVRKIINYTPIKSGELAKSVQGNSILDLSDRRVARFVLSLFSLYETWNPATCEADIATLEQAPMITISRQELKEFQSWIKRYGPRFRERFVRSTVEKSKDFLSLKGGPNGIATLWSHLDAKTLLSHTDYLAKYIKYSSKIEGTSPSEELQKLLDIPNVSTKQPVSYVFKTIGIPDKGPKVRTITMGNYFLQRSLRPLHDSMMRTLRSIPEDGTYRQDKAAQSVKDWTLKGRQPFCFDLTSATDLFPFTVQYLVIKELYPEIATEWYSLLRKAESYEPSRCLKFRFNVGQPMGVYTSWAAFTLTHHFIIRYAFHKAGSSFRGNYYIIGDDVAIICPKAASEYKRIILGLGIPISSSKSITPDNIKSSTDSVAELAKRYFRNGIEITPVRPYELDSISGKGWPLFLELAPNLIHRWGVEDCSKLLTLPRFPPVMEGNFLSWVDKAHRKNLLLIASRNQRALPFNGEVPNWWPKEGSPKLIKAEGDAILDKTAKLIEQLITIGKLTDDWLSNGTQLQLSKEKLMNHPLHKALNLSKDQIKSIRKRFDKGDPNTIDLVYQLGINLDLLLSMLKTNKSVKDYMSLRSKRSTASAQAQLDIWTWTITKYGFNPVDEGYPAVRSSKLFKKSKEVCYAMHRYALLFNLKKLKKPSS